MIYSYRQIGLGNNERVPRHKGCSTDKEGLGHLLISSQDVSPLRVGLIVNVVGMMAITILHNRGCILSVRYAVPMVDGHGRPRSAQHLHLIEEDRGKSEANRYSPSRLL